MTQGSFHLMYLLKELAVVMVEVVAAGFVLSAIVVVVVLELVVVIDMIVL